jgi:N-acyl-D-aspartate/D-glutamate deacylase
MTGTLRLNVSFIICVFLSLGLNAAVAADVDILLKGGTIMDGTGAEPYEGSVAIRDGRIVAVGKTSDVAARQTIDCNGLVICPGFIDLHNHSDESILKRKARSAVCYLTQGCTTLVTGNCGGGKEDIGKFYEDLDARGTGINIAQLVPHGAVRENVMGKGRRAPTADELKKMQDFAEQGMREGAWGISTGLQYVPGAFAKTDELIAMASVVAKHGGFYASHIRDEGDTLIESIDEVIEIAKGANIACHVSHLKSSKRPNWGKVRAAAHLIEEARNNGLKITADQYPYTASSTSIMAMVLPEKERDGGDKAVVARLKDREQLTHLRPIMAGMLNDRGKIMVASFKKKHEWDGQFIEDIAANEHREPVEVAVELMLGDPDVAGVNFGMDEADVRYVMTLPWVATASDGSSKVNDGTRPHPRSFGTFPRKIGRYAIQEHVVSLPAAIRSATGLPADILGMTDRGYIRESLVADIAVIDPKSFEDRATYEDPFTPSVGVRWLFLGGRAAIADGTPQKILAGKPLRRKDKLE